jgi:CSLREA domain-containing protein
MRDGHVGHMRTGGRLRRCGRFGLALLLAILANVGALAPVPAAHAATFTVDSTLDEHDGAPGDRQCRSTPSRRCTLRAAIEEANATPASDTITVPAGTYTLPLGELRIRSPMAVVGAGTTATIVQAATTPSVATSRVLSVGGAILEELPSQFRALVQSLTIRHGVALGPQNSFGELRQGGGILLGRRAELALVSVAVERNVAGVGGGISISSTTSAGTRLVMSDTIISRNHATEAVGGLHCTNSGNAEDLPVSDYPSWRLSRSSIVSNTTDGQHGGTRSFICTGEGDRSLIASNRSRGGGGGMSTEHGVYRLTNSTIAQNIVDTGSASNIDREAGGLTSSSSQPAGLSLESVTIARNLIVNRPASFPSRGHNLHFDAFASMPPDFIQVKNSIIANPLLPGPSCTFGANGATAAPIGSLGGNVEFPGNGCNLTPLPGFVAPDLIGVNPVVGVLADNGGPTQTLALAANSPAIDLMPASACVSVDQRGLPRPRDGNGDGASRCDSGAFEVQAGR